MRSPLREVPIITASDSESAFNLRGHLAALVTCQLLNKKRPALTSSSISPFTPPFPLSQQASGAQGCKLVLL